MNTRSIILAATAAFSLVSSPVSWSEGPMGTQPAHPQNQRPPSEGELWENLDQTLKNVQRKRELEAEAERIERGGGQHRGDGPMSRGERESDREHFVGKSRAAERRLSSVVHRRQKLVNDMLNMYSKHPSPGLKQAIKRNSQKLSAEREELERTRGFIRRNQ